MALFGPMSKKKILKGVDEQIQNKYLALTDVVLEFGENTPTKLRADLDRLRKIRGELERLLD